MARKWNHWPYRQELVILVLSSRLMEKSDVDGMSSAVCGCLRYARLPTGRSSVAGRGVMETALMIALVERPVIGDA